MERSAETGQPEVWGNGCECWVTPEHIWTTHYGAVEPGSQLEFNPECPKHGKTTCLDRQGGGSMTAETDAVGDEATCHYCHGQIVLRHLGGYGDFWLLAGGTAPYEGRGVCPAREDDGHNPTEEQA